MNNGRIGYFTAEALEISWLNFSVIRNRHHKFYTVELMPDNQAFCETLNYQSNFEIPTCDFVKKRDYAELIDGQYISVIKSDEISVAKQVTLYLNNINFSKDEWIIVEKYIINFLKFNISPFINNTIVDIGYICGEEIRGRLVERTNVLKWFIISNNTDVKIIRESISGELINYPSFKLLHEKMKKYVCFSIFNAEKEPSFLLKAVSTSKFNVHPKGCIIIGNTGSGRSFLCQKIANELKLGISRKDLADLSHYDVKFKELDRIFQSKTLVMLVNFDVCFNGENSTFQRRVESQLASLIDRNEGVFFAMIVNSKENIPITLQSSKRLGNSLLFPPLSKEDIKFILGGKSSNKTMDNCTGLPAGYLIKAFQSGNIHEFFEEVPLMESSIKGSIEETGWDDIGGHLETKRTIREAVEWPLTRSKEFLKFGINPPHGVLLYGPPGCGKTMFARAIATTLSSSFFFISAASIFQMYLGESERIVRELFDLARQKAPSVIFIDEIDAIVGKRGKSTGVTKRVLSTFLNEMDGITYLKDVIVVAATNRPDSIDDA